MFAAAAMSLSSVSVIGNAPASEAARPLTITAASRNRQGEVPDGGRSYVDVSGLLNVVNHERTGTGPCLRARIRTVVRIREVTPVFQVKNVQASVDFYWPRRDGTAAASTSGRAIQKPPPHGA
jgi:hypothetical protein